MICWGVACCTVIDVITTPEEHLLRAIIASVDMLPIILEFLPLNEIMRSRRVCKQWREATRKTIVPDIFYVNSVTQYNILGSMVTKLPNLQQIRICRHDYDHKWGNDGFGWDSNHKYNDGEDPDEGHAARTADYRAHDIEIISNFSKLHVLKIEGAELNGRYPVLFNSFPLLQKLSISDCYYLKFDLEMLAGLPTLKELYCANNRRLTGNINSLRVLKDTLEKVDLQYCYNVEGNFMNLADFPRLKKLDLYETAVTGDIRDIGENDFSSLEQLSLPKDVYSGNGYELQHIVDARGLVRAVTLFKKQGPALSRHSTSRLQKRNSSDCSLVRVMMTLTHKRY